LSQEAESGALSGQFVVGKDAKANTGKYIYTPNQGLFWEGPVAWQKASYCFNVENPGVYRILISVAAPDINSDSFYVQVDGAPAAGYLWDIALSQSYAIDYVNDRDHADPIELSLSFGQHIVAFYVREDGARLDRIQLEPVTLTDKEQVTFIPTQHATQVD
jgi:predicted secreted protein